MAELAAIEGGGVEVRDPNRRLDSADPPPRGSADPAVHASPMQDVLRRAKPFLPS